MRLNELQAAMRAGILGEPTEALLAEIDGCGLASAARLRIHRNNTLFGLTEALRTSFPAVARLVGDRFFDFAADRFIRGAPPREPRLANYGAGFPAFLAGFEPARTLPYLPDIARLEWAVNLAYNAPDEAPLAPAALVDLAPDAYPRLRLALHSSCRLVRSGFPIKRIWLANRPGAETEGTIDLAEGGATLLVMRREFEVVLIEIEPAEHDFLASLRDGGTIETACTCALATDAAFDLAGLLARQFARGSFARAILPAP